MKMRKVLFSAVLLFLVPLAARAQSGTVRGRVLDIDGSPQAAIRVAVTPAVSASATRTTIELIALTQTDGSGQFTLDGVPAGKYFVVAGAIDFPTYFPGTTTAVDATVVEVRPGGTARDINFSLSQQARARVRGRVLNFRTAPAALPITLSGARRPSVTTYTSDDGSFEFSSLSLGMYTLNAPGLEPLTVTVDRGDVLVEMVPASIGAGVRLSGTLIEQSTGLPSKTERTVMLSLLTGPPQLPITSGVRTFGNLTAGTLEAFVGRDGSFEFPQVPQGTYVLRPLPAVAGVASRRIEVADTDIEGIQITVPFALETSGRVEIPDGVPDGNPIFTATQGTFSASTSIRPDGTFNIRLTEGENRISLDRIPTHLAVKSIRYGGTDVTHSPLRVTPGAQPQQIVVTLESVPENQGPGVIVQGNTTGANRLSAAGIPITLTPAGLGGKPFETYLRTDGSFEFTNVTPGVYTLRVSPPFTAFTRVVVSDTNLQGIEVRIPAKIEVSGTIRVVDNGGIAAPPLPANVSMKFLLQGGMSTVTGIKADGSFTVPLPEGEYVMSLANLPVDYAVRWIVAGDVDLTQSALSIDASHTPSNLEVLLEHRTR